MGRVLIMFGHRLVGDPVKVDEGFEAVCECGQTGWGMSTLDATLNLTAHFDQVGVMA